jgi:hypothetical protein
MNIHMLFSVIYHSLDTIRDVFLVRAQHLCDVHTEEWNVCTTVSWSQFILTSLCWPTDYQHTILHHLAIIILTFQVLFSYSSDFVIPLILYVFALECQNPFS